MKTTIEIADPLLEEARRGARAEGTTLRELVEQGLRAVLQQRQPEEPFKLEDQRRGEGGLQPGLDWGDWASMRDLIYEGHGA